MILLVQVIIVVEKHHFLLLIISLLTQVRVLLTPRVPSALVLVVGAVLLQLF
jgi:hypothetical protein